MPRAGLSSRAVIESAARVLDEQGEEGLSIALLAERLGVRPPSLYKHVDGMAGIRRGVTLRAKADLATALGNATIGMARDDAVRGLALAYRRWAKVHPGQYPLTIRAPIPGDTDDEEVSQTLVNVLYRVLSGYRIDAEDDLVDATRHLRSALHGFVDLETSGAFQLSRGVEQSFAGVIDSLTTWLTSWSGTRASGDHRGGGARDR